MRAVIRQLTDLPVTCGHELSAQLDSIRRATTTALNAQLIPLISGLIRSVQDALAEANITAPLLIVRGDGSLMSAEMALERPAETILSGPASSALGAAYLGGCDDAWVVDMGGTTSDIVLLRNGCPRLSEQGADVGGWLTMVRAVDARTVGLGGDSHVGLDRKGGLRIGPRRVVPLSLVATSNPTILSELQTQLETERVDRPGEFLFSCQRGASCRAVDEAEAGLLSALSRVPRSWQWLQSRVSSPYSLDGVIERMESRGLVAWTAFTPTDALHVLGSYTPWSTDAARLGATLLARLTGDDPHAFCRRVRKRVGDLITCEVLGKLIADEDRHGAHPNNPISSALLERALGSHPDSDLRCKLELRRPLVGMGAPATAYLGRVAEQFRTRLVVPDYAAMANAVGAVVGSVIQMVEALVIPVEGTRCFRLHLPGEARDFDNCEEAVAYAKVKGGELARHRALSAGASDIKIGVQRRDRRARVGGGWGDALYLGTELRFTAIGRPDGLSHRVGDTRASYEV